MRKIAILTTVANFKLYDKTSHLFGLEYDRYVIDGRNGMYGIQSILYMMKKFKNLDYDYIIMADEDFVLKSNNTLTILIDEMNKNNITVSGVRDGGVINHRNYNPFCVNTFFSVIDLNKIKLIWNRKEMLSNQKIEKEEFFLNEVLDYKYDESSLYESYYCFYLWLLRKGEKIKYLTSKSLELNNDSITNVIYHNSIIIGFHSWYARAYGTNKKHTERIDLLLNGLESNSITTVNYVLWKDSTFKYRLYIKKFFRRIRIKLNRIK
ncbi:hypothetical protein BTO15_12155 [Polaribacter sejongensis]|uniref:Nucleotide-diphospho-sugar transferase domain-containing protein n=1 Tax=Polaribacter sejongensis TaxID=985043 RepID=A0ABN5F6T4_9FLAO|nr:hypothetical protein [Polaribacter sejongensis]AUC22793.1 hypothetical protein BTO15_12155 [Polaribacter sejongensis]